MKTMKTANTSGFHSRVWINTIVHCKNTFLVAFLNLILFYFEVGIYFILFLIQSSNWSLSEVLHGFDFLYFFSRPLFYLVFLWEYDLQINFEVTQNVSYCRMLLYLHCNSVWHFLVYTRVLGGLWLT